MADTPVPEKYLEFAKAIGALAQQYGLQDLQAEFRPDVFSGWHSAIRFHWQAGRHGAEGNRIRLTATQDIFLDITQKEG